MLRKSALVAICGGAKVYSRGLYSVAALGVEGYKMHREKIKTQHLHGVDNFKRKMREFVAGTTTNMVFTEDLKNMIHLMENSAEDKQLLVDMVARYNTQSKEVRFGNYVFGPVVMRACYYLNDAQFALDLFRDEKFEGFFDQLSTYQVLGDLLYESGRYQDVRELFDVIKGRQVQGGRYPKHSVTLTFAACYKENTPEAYRYAMELWQELNSVGHMPMRKATAFAAALALNHGQPDIAMEITGTITKGNYVTIRQLKTLAICALNRVDDMVPLLRAVLEVKGPFDKKQTFCREVIKTMQETIARQDPKTVSPDLPRMLEYLETNGHVTDETMDSLLCQQVQTTAQTKPHQSNLAESYKTHGGSYQPRTVRHGRSYQSLRPGLADMN